MSASQFEGLILPERGISMVAAMMNNDKGMIGEKEDPRFLQVAQESRERVQALFEFFAQNNPEQVGRLSEKVLGPFTSLGLGNNLEGILKPLIKEHEQRIKSQPPLRGRSRELVAPSERPKRPERPQVKGESELEKSPLFQQQKFMKEMGETVSEDILKKWGKGRRERKFR
jgi:hypothetical protein